MQNQFGATPVASIARVESGGKTYAVGASVIARADDSSLQVLSDVAGLKVVLSDCLLQSGALLRQSHLTGLLKFAQTCIALMA